MSKEEYILIVEDSLTQAQQLESILRYLGYTCSVAGNGREALGLLRKQKPLLVVADILMPEMDGYELCRQIKADKETMKIPVVLLTQLSEPREIMKGLECGADDFLIKPYNEEIILGRVQTILSLKQKQEAALGNINILIVEDSPTQAEHLRFILEEKGYTVTYAANGADGLALAKKIIPSVVITDIIMPVMDGYEFVGKLKLEESLKNIPVIFITSLKDSKQVVRRVSVVADGFFTKPYDEKYLLSKIETLIALSQQTYENIELKGVEINFEGECFVINSGFRQIVNFLLSTYEGACRQNRDLIYMQRELQQLNQQLETKVMERTRRLKASEENFRAFAENSSDGIIITTGDGQHVYVNRRMTEMTGYSVDELLKATVKDIIIPSDVQRISGKFKRRLEGKSVQDQYETYILTKDKREVLVDISTSKTVWQNDPAVMVISRDITVRKKIVEDLIRKDKLESVGILAGGIAHDFNNLLTGILGSVSMAKMTLSPEDKVHHLLSDVEKATFRARDLTRQLLTFSKGGAPIKQTASIDDVTRESASFAIRGSNVRCLFLIPEDLWLVEVDKGQFSQVINNLVLNAVQAMEKGGEVIIAAENVTTGINDNIPLTDGRYVKISIKDSGAGISRENLTKIFDPYFTTKDTGTGLGLASVYSIVRSHDGYITVDSESGSGTTFYIFLPVSVNNKISDIMHHHEEGYIHGKGKILIMDDEDLIRDVAGEMLTSLGYEICGAKDGVEAIELYKKDRESGKPFDAVIMDLTVPGGMGGTEAIKRMLEIDPSVKAIVSSGYSNDMIMSEYKKYGFAAFIVKPYRFTELSKVVHQVVTGS